MFHCCRDGIENAKTRNIASRFEKPIRFRIDLLEFCFEDVFFAVIVAVKGVAADTRFVDDLLKRDAVVRRFFLDELAQGIADEGRYFTRSFPLWHKIIPFVPIG